ncbi:MAG: hypothetical protein R3B70_00020 [Polyangiaceae bacterium]
MAWGVPLWAGALDATQGRKLVVDGLDQSLGVLGVLALGRTGDSCRYLGSWESPVNDNDIVLCDLRERLTLLHPSCLQNGHVDITSVVTAGPGGLEETACSGFDLMGVAIRTGDVTLLLSERAAEPVLAGIAVLPGGLALPVIGVRVEGDGEKPDAPADPRKKLLTLWKRDAGTGAFEPPVARTQPR